MKSAKTENFPATSANAGKQTGDSLDNTLALWRSALVEPRAVFAQQAAKADLGKAVLWFALGGAVSALLSTLFHIWLGVALLKARKVAWITQVVLGVIGLLGFPLWTILNGVILIFFFRPAVRDRFQV